MPRIGCFSRLAPPVGASRSRHTHSENAFVVVAVIAATCGTGSGPASAAEPATIGAPAQVAVGETRAAVVGLKYNCVHVLKLEETLELYREVLGFKMVDAEVLRGPGIEGMLVMKLRAGDFTVCLSLPAPKHLDTVGPVGNTNHNHFMLVVNDIVSIGDKLKQAGYELENPEYARDKYTFFTGPNGEIVGLTEYR